MGELDDSNPTLDISAVADAVASAVKLGPPPPPLPPGWIIKESQSNPGYFYYYNMETGMFTWQSPIVGSAGGNQMMDENMNDAEMVAAAAEAAVAAAGNGKSILKANAKQQHQRLPPRTPPSLPSAADPETADDRSSKRRKHGGDGSSSNSNSPKEVRVLHILKKHKGSRRPASWRNPKITQTLEESKEELQGLLEILIEEESNPDELRATFEELARTESDCSSAKRGGDLGFFGRRKMQPAFEEASFGLKVGELTKSLVETSSGVHLIYRIG